MDTTLHSPDRSRGLGFLVGLGTNLILGTVAWAAFIGESPMPNDEIGRWTMAIGVAAIGIGTGAVILSERRRYAAGIVLGSVAAVLLELVVLVAAIVLGSA